MHPSLLHDSLGDQFGIAVLVNLLIEFLKRWKFLSFISADTDKLNRALSGLIAVFYTAGFRFAVDGSFMGGGELHLHFPPLVALGQLLLDSAGSFGTQELVYKLGMKSGAPMERLVETIRKALPWQAAPPVLPSDVAAAIADMQAAVARLASALPASAAPESK